MVEIETALREFPYETKGGPIKSPNKYSGKKLRYFRYLPNKGHIRPSGVYPMAAEFGLFSSYPPSGKFCQVGN